MSITTNMFVVGSVIAVVYFLLKFIEMRFVETDGQKPMKVLIRDTIVVCVASVLGIFVIDQFKILEKSGDSSSAGSSAAPAVFVDTPGF